jgi:hypothetical protein
MVELVKYMRSTGINRMNYAWKQGDCAILYQYVTSVFPKHGFTSKNTVTFTKKNVSVNTNTLDVMYLVLMKNVFVIIRSRTQKVTSIVHKDDAAY